MCTRFGATRHRRHITSQPTAMPRARSRAGERVLLGRGEHGGNDHRAGVHRAALERVVVVLAVRGGAVAQRGGSDVEAARMTDQRARSGLRRCAERRLHVVAVARGDAQARDVHQHGIAHRRQHRRGASRHFGERRRQLLRYGDFRKRHGTFLWMRRYVR